MYSDEFNRECRNDALFWKREIIPVDITHISVSDMDGQIRKNGIQESHVKALAEDIELRGRLLVPITVDKNTMTVVEGNHRYEAFRLLNEREKGKWGQIDTRLRTFFSDQEKRAYQLEANDDPPRKGSTPDDYIDLIVKDLHNNRCNGITWDNYNNDSSNHQALVDLYKSRWDKLSIHANTIKKYVRLAARAAPGSKFKYRMMNDETQALSCWSGSKWKSKKETNGWGLLTIGQHKHIMPNLVGNAFKKKLKSPNKKITVLANCAELDGKSGADLDNWRVTLVESINSINNAGLLNMKLYDELIFSPHKIEDDCVENGFFRVKKKSNGDFDPDCIPTSGW